MKGLLTAGLALFAALEASAAATATAGARYVDLDLRGRRGQVLEYDGRTYGQPWFDLGVGGEGSWGLFDAQAADIASGEESGSVNLDYKDWLKLDASAFALSHRFNYVRDGSLVNGDFFANSNILNYTAPGEEFVVKRIESEANVAFVCPTDAARWLSLGYWRVDKRGSFPASYASHKVGAADVDNIRQDVMAGFGLGLGPTAALSLSLVASGFQDRAVSQPAVNGTATSTLVVHPIYATQHMRGGELKWRWTLGRLAMSGALTGRQRLNRLTNFRRQAGVAAFNAAYNTGGPWSLSGRLYSRYAETHENTGYSPSIQNGGNTHKSQLDKLTVSGEAAASYAPAAATRVKGSWKLELNHRRDGSTLVYSAPRYYVDGTYYPEMLNSTAREDTKHVLKVGVEQGLPLGIQTEASYERLQANRPAFVNQPNWRDEVAGSVAAPLPSRLLVTLMASYTQERNNVDNFSAYSAMAGAYRAALDWAATKAVSVGLDGSYETLRYFTRGYFGSGSATWPSTVFIVQGMPNRQRNTTGGAHGRVGLPKGFAVTAEGAYTRSLVQTPIEYRSTGDGGYTVGDYTPSDVRIARGGAGIEYTPPRWPQVTARLSYRVDDWVDKTDTLNSGRASFAQAAVSAKF